MNSTILYKADGPGCTYHPIERNFDPSPHPHRNGKTSLPGHFFSSPPVGKLTLVSMALAQKTFAMLLLSVVRDSTFSQRAYILGFSSVCILACFQNDQSFPDADCLSTNNCGRVLSCPFRGGNGRKLTLAGKRQTGYGLNGAGK